MTQGVHRAARLRGDVTATVYGNRRRIWREVADRIARLAAGLKSLGLDPGDRVMIIAQNSDLYIEAMYAIWWAGAVLVPGNYRWSAGEHLFAIEDCGARTILLGHDYLPLADLLRKTMPEVTIIALDAALEETAGMATSEQLITDNGAVPDVCGRGDALCALFYTGGTTGRSKGVMLSHENLMFSFFAVQATVPLPPDPIFLHLPPMFHVGGAGAVIANTLFAGTHVILPAFSPAALVQTIERERISAALIVPTMFQMLREHLADHPCDLSSMKLVRYGTAPISENLLRHAIAIFPNASFMQGYGQTELAPIATILEPRFHGRDGNLLLRSAGRAALGVDVKITRPDGTNCGHGEVGEIRVRSPGRMIGYWNQPELTAETIVDGWVRTGDAGHMDENGFLFIVDRLKDMIVSGGENIFSSEVENALSSHADVAECAVIGVPDERWGERVHAIVRLKPGGSADEHSLVAHSRTLIASYKCPRTIEFRQEPLPLSPQGKILKAELRKPFWEGRTRLVG
ncbi:MULTISPECIES: acyl-CoA synthetase [unclassified Sphingomonas]|uniref:acyl-CoA synthetase n=1 Tax=unclassified Sphingomonas TaxID=196159 RepID=UPI000B030DAA|nr:MULTISPECIES: long-chain fatty acid--CoA ligase [unclassified Sphingomonas]